jgi:hypothetical protein
MNFEEAVAEVKLTTKRPDKLNLIRRKVNAAISFFSMDSNFKRDYAEQTVTLNPLEYTQSFALSLLPRFRNFHYLKLAGTKIFLKVLPDDELFKKCNNSSRYYIAGDDVNVSLPELTAGLDVGYFKYPATLTGEDTHWMLDMSPYMIIDWASAEIFKDIGDDKSFRDMRATARELYLAFRKNQEISTQ